MYFWTLYQHKNKQDCPTLFAVTYKQVAISKNWHKLRTVTAHQ